MNVSCCLFMLGLISGCSILPDIRHKAQLHNPFPQLSRVAVLPFRNQSQEPTLSGARVSMAYYNELQSIPGFEVIPYGVVENQLAAFETRVLMRPISSAKDFQSFAEFLGVDAVLQGAITDYSAYYPPRMTLKVNWYAANPGLHPVPAGYGLPWGTKAEKKIPTWIKLEAERALAKEQIATQSPIRTEQEQEEIPMSPAPEPQFQPLPPRIEEVPAAPVNPNDIEQPTNVPESERETLARAQKKKIESARVLLPRVEKQAYTSSAPRHSIDRDEPERVNYADVLDTTQKNAVREAKPNWSEGTEVDSQELEEPPRLPAKLSSQRQQPELTVNPDGTFSLVPDAMDHGLDPDFEMEDGSVFVVEDPTLFDAYANGIASDLPADWPDPTGFIPSGPRAERPKMVAQQEPVISHMKAYNGNDEDFTQSLQEYFYFRDDARFGGWQSYLQRSEDFIRFCCHLHVSETLAARGGQLESRLNVRWPIYRYQR
ncbi:MAG: hypothetical protein KGQ60_00305 [Planctomycetes bacterium]|nr:hypothetical protein [Planctomycetota bacterium]